MCNPEVLLQDVESFDLVAITFQEVPRSKKSQRYDELNQFMTVRGFVSLDSSFC